LAKICSSWTQPQLPCRAAPADVVTLRAASAFARFFTTPENVTMIGAATPTVSPFGICTEARSVAVGLTVVNLPEIFVCLPSFAAAMPV